MKKITSLLLFALLSIRTVAVCGCPTIQADSTAKRTVGILIFYNAEVLDFAGPFEVFAVANQIHNDELFDVYTIAKTTDPITAVNGLSVNPDFSFENAPELDILILSGGMGVSLLINDQETLDWVAEKVNDAELTMSVCTGAALLAQLGRLENKPYCTHHTVYPFIENMDPSAEPQKDLRFVQSDSRLFTSAGISAGIDLSFHIVELLYGKDVAQYTATYMEYKGYE